MADYKIRTFKGFFWNHISKLAEYGLTYIFGILLARNLGAIQYSIYVTLMSLASFSIILGGLGLDETLNKYVPRITIEKGNSITNYLVKKLLRYRVFALLIITVIIFIFRNEIANLIGIKNFGLYLIVLSFYIFLQSLVNYFSNFFIAQLKTRIVLVINLITKFLTLGIGIYLLATGHDLYSIILLLAIISALTILLYLGSGGYKFIFAKIAKVEIKEPISFGITTWGNMLLTFMLGKNSNIIILSLIIGNLKQIGFYEIAFSFTQLIEYVFAVGFTGVALSSFSSLAVTDNEKLKDLRTLLIKYFQFIIFPVSMYVLFNAEFIIKLIYSDQYIPSIFLLRIFLVFNIISVSFLGSGSNTAVLFAIGKEKMVLVVRLITGLLNIILILLIVPTYGIIAAISITGACLLISVTFEFLLAGKFIGWKYDYLYLMKIVFVCFFALGISVLFAKYVFQNHFINMAVYSFIILLGYHLLKIVDLRLKKILLQIHMVMQ